MGSEYSTRAKMEGITKPEDTLFKLNASTRINTFKYLKMKLPNTYNEYNTIKDDIIANLIHAVEGKDLHNINRIIYYGIRPLSTIKTVQRGKDEINVGFPEQNHLYLFDDAMRLAFDSGDLATFLIVKQFDLCLMAERVPYYQKLVLEQSVGITQMLLERSGDDYDSVDDDEQKNTNNAEYTPSELLLISILESTPNQHFNLVVELTWKQIECSMIDVVLKRAIFINDIKTISFIIKEIGSEKVKALVEKKSEFLKLIVGSNDLYMFKLFKDIVNIPGDTFATYMIKSFDDFITFNNLKTIEYILLNSTRAIPFHVVETWVKDGINPMLSQNVLEPTSSELVLF